MEKVRLGRTELLVTKTAFGALPIQRISTAEAVKVLAENEGNRIIGILDGRLADMDMEEALAMTKTFQMDRYQILEALTNSCGPDF